MKSQQRPSPYWSIQLPPMQRCEQSTLHNFMQTLDTKCPPPRRHKNVLKIHSSLFQQPEKQITKQPESSFRRRRLYK